MRLQFIHKTSRLLALLCLTLPACTNSAGEPLPVNVIDFTDGGLGPGCIQTPFPADQPDLSLLNPPRFLLTTSTAQQSTSGQAIVDPGDPAEAEVTVNGATRRVIVELVDAWSPQRVIFADELETPGNETISLLLETQAWIRGRFYMKLTLCGSDCDELQVIFDINPDINSPYERTVVEGRDVVQVDRTCVNLGARRGVGSGTVLIQ